jgi:hypothetical protein
MDSVTVFVAGAGAMGILAAQARGAPPHALILAGVALGLGVAELHERRREAARRRAADMEGSGREFPAVRGLNSARALRDARASDEGRVRAIAADVRAFWRAIARMKTIDDADAGMRRARDLRNRVLESLEALTWTRPEESRILRLAEGFKQQADGAMRALRSRVHGDPDSPQPYERWRDSSVHV